MAISSSSALWIGTVALVIVAAALVVIAHNSRTAVRRIGSPLQREQLRAYHELMSAIVSLNRKAVKLNADDLFQLEQERYVMDNESELEEEIVDVIEAYHRSFYLISAGVRDAVGNYVDYVSEYHPNNGVQIENVLKLSGEVVEAIRSDLDLESAFPDTGVDDDVSPDQLPDQSGSDGPVSDDSEQIT